MKPRDCETCDGHGNLFEFDAASQRTIAFRCPACTSAPKRRHEEHNDERAIRNYQADRDDPKVFKRTCSHLAVARRYLGLPIDPDDIVIAAARETPPEVDEEQNELW